MILVIKNYPVIQWAKKTGDYSVLSHPDLCVLALTYMLDQEDKKEKEKEKEQKQETSTSASTFQKTVKPFVRSLLTVDD